MNTPNKLRTLVKSVIKEVKEEKAKKNNDKAKAKAKPKPKEKKEKKLPKSSGKLMEMKKELASLMKMREQLGMANLGQVIDENETMVEFADLQPFLSELSSLKENSTMLEQKITERISQLEGLIGEEKNKIREMIGLQPQKSITEEKPTSTPVDESKKKPSSGLNKKQKSNIVKGARAGKDFGKKGKNFDKVAAAAGGGEKGKKIAAAQFWKQQAK